MAEERKEGLSEGQSMLLWAVGVAIALYLLSIYRPELLRFWQRAAVWHTQVLSLVDDVGPGRAFYNLIGVSGDQMVQLGTKLASIDAALLNKQTVWNVSEYIGRVLRWFLGPLLILLALDVMNYPKRYRRHFPNGAALFNYVKTHFGRHLARADNGLKADLYKGEHAVAKTPWQWCVEHQCVSANEMLDAPKAIAVLRRQLGPLFTTWDALIKGERGWIAKEILGFLKSKADQDGVIVFATRGHIYESTVLVALLLGTRRFGVVSCMHFAGLRRRNRALWYALESAGRRVAFIEGAGILAQYEYEMALHSKGKGQLSAQEGRVEAAISGLNEALEFEVKEVTEQEKASTGVWADYDPTK
jgi:hypothetical protein